MFGGGGDQGRPRTPLPAATAQPQAESLQPFPVEYPAYGQLVPQMQPAASVIPDHAQGQPHFLPQHTILAHIPPSLGSPPLFQHRPLSLGPLPPFPPPTQHYVHAPAQSWCPVTIQSYPQHSVIPAGHISLHHPPVFTHHYHSTVPPAPSPGVGEQTYPLSHPPQVLPSQPVLQAFPSVVPLQHSTQRPSSQATIIRPIPVYRTPQPGFEALLRHGPVHGRPPAPSRQSAEGQLVQMPYVTEEISASSQSSQMQSNAPPPSTSTALTAEAESESSPLVSVDDPMEGTSHMQEMEEYRDFAKAFKEHRIKLGYNQTDVSQQIGLRYGYVVSEGDIVRFESQSLEVDEVQKLKPVFEMWVSDTAKAAGSSEEQIGGIAPSRRVTRRPRRSRTSLHPIARERLEAEFCQKPKPTQAEMGMLADILGIDKDFIRIWFCNRRQREKKKTGKTLSSASTPPTTEATLTILSPSHDITLEVPTGGEEAILPSTADVYITQSSSQNQSYEESSSQNQSYEDL